jgi:hypothetical protein
MLSTIIAICFSLSLRLTVITAADVNNNLNYLEWAAVDTDYPRYAVSAIELIPSHQIQEPTDKTGMINKLTRTSILANP